MKPSPRKLEIKLLSKSGEVLSKVACHAGQVTVLRANSPQELRTYQRALAGVPGPEKFGITLDEVSFTPESAILIGFGESFPRDPMTVAAFLEKNGIIAESLEAVLVSYGLEGISSTGCHQLSSDQERRLRLIAALHSPSDKVLILNEPFEDLASQWRERFAELIVSHTRAHQRLVVIPSLTYRPEHWIDNPLIARVQVGETMQRTIGFGAGSTQVNEMVKQVRSLFSSEQEAQEAVEKMQSMQKAPRQQEKSAKPQGSKQPEQQGAGETSFASTVAMEAKEWGAKLSEIRKKPAVLKAFDLGREQFKTFVAHPRMTTGVGCAMLALLVWFKVTGEPPQATEPVAVNPPVEEPVVETPPVEEPTNAAVNEEPAQEPPPVEVVANPEPEPQPEVKEPPPPPPQSKYVLELYPTDIRASILAAFNTASVGKSGHPFAMPLPKERNAQGEKPVDDLFRALQGTSESGKDLPDSGPYHSPETTEVVQSENIQEMDVEQRRELIRQKFLEAIERAAEKRREAGEEE